MIWGSALRQRELLVGLVDVRDSDLSAELHGMEEDDDSARGTKRPAESDYPDDTLSHATFAGIHPTDLERRSSLGRPTSQAMGESNARRRSSAGASSRASGDPARLSMGSTGSPTTSHGPPLRLPLHQPLHPESMYNQGPYIPQAGHEGAHQSYELLAEGGPAPDLSLFRSPPGSTGGVTNFSDM